MARVSELLDRKLFEASVSSEVTQIAADVHGFEETVAAVLGVLGRIVDYDLAAVCMLDDRADLPHRRPGVARSCSTPSSSAPSRTPPPR